MQELLVAIMIMAAVSYGGWRTYQVFRRAADPCYGCDGCPLKAHKQTKLKKKENCWNKK